VVSSFPHLIPSGISTILTKSYKEKFEQAFPNNPVNCVINTHAHPEHYRGNSVFPEAVITGHKNGLEEMDKDRPEKDQWLNAIQ
jgi:glyoxylase-like metal-dependent hydrolase (beta-lactamase superfamily II)